jgi:hypothetical protein
MSSFHLAGIVPVAGQSLEFNMPWHDCMMPLAPDYLAIEKSIVACAHAGCETIWVVCNQDTQPLIRYRLGDYVQDPVWEFRKFEKRANDFQKIIPIFYVPIHPNDRDKRDCLSWSVLYGAHTSNKISRSMSRWLAPDMYFVDFPYGVYQISDLRSSRNTISSEKNFSLAHQNNTVSNNMYLPFTFSFEDYKTMNRELKKNSTGLYKNYDLENGQKLPLKDRYSARFFDLEHVFNNLKFENIHEIDWYYSIDSWQGYIKFLNEKGDSVRKPPKSIFKYREFNGIGINNEDNAD